MDKHIYIGVNNEFGFDIVDTDYREIIFENDNELTFEVSYIRHAFNELIAKAW
jgi:hypothetical protein